MLRLDGDAWVPVGALQGPLTVQALAAGDLGEGPRLFAAAGVIYAWDGSVWAPISDGFFGLVEALHVSAVMGDPDLFVGGPFETSVAGDALLARFGRKAVSSVAGCGSNAASLATPSTASVFGSPLGLTVVADQAFDGLAVLFAGPLAIDGGGCGLDLPGIGEWLLSVTAPSLVTSSLALGVADLTVTVPYALELVGLTLGLPAVAIDVGALAPVELSNAVAVELGS